MQHFIKALVLLAGFFYSNALLAQFDTPPPNAPVKPEKLNQFIKDSIEGHYKKTANIQYSYKYCLPHICLNRMGKYALVGYDHHPITAFEFDDISGNWLENVYIVRKGMLSGCMDTSGKLLLPVQYPQLSRKFLPEYLISESANPKETLVFNSQGKSILPKDFQYAGMLLLGGAVIKARKALGDTLYLFDANGTQLTAYAAYDIKLLGSFKGNRYTVQLSADSWSGKQLVIDNNFQVIAPADLQKPRWSNDKWVYYDGNDQESPKLYDIAAQKAYPIKGLAYPFEQHTALLLKDEGKYGLLDETLKTIVPPKFQSIQHLDGQDLFILTTQQYQYGLMDGTGKMILDTIYSQIHKTENPTLFKVNGNLYQTDKKAFITGNPILLTPYLYRTSSEDGPPKLMHINGTEISTPFGIYPTPTRIIVQKKSSSNEMQVYDYAGKLISTLEMSARLKAMDIPDQEYYIWTHSNGKVGVLDADLNIIFQPQYDTIHLFNTMPEQFAAIWAKYTFRKQEYLYVGWVWNNDKTLPLLLKKNGTVVSILELN